MVRVMIYHNDLFKSLFPKKFINSRLIIFIEVAAELNAAGAVTSSVVVNETAVAGNAITDRADPVTCFFGCASMLFLDRWVNDDALVYFAQNTEKLDAFSAIISTSATRWNRFLEDTIVTGDVAAVVAHKPKRGCIRKAYIASCDDFFLFIFLFFFLLTLICFDLWGGFSR